MDQPPVAHIDSPVLVAASVAPRRFVSGWRSTKLHLALITMAMIWGSWFILVLRTEKGNVGPSLDVLVMGLLGAAGIYSASNVGATIASRNPNQGTSP